HYSITVTDGATTDLETEPVTCLAADQALAIVSGGEDAIEEVADELGLPYTLYDDAGPVSSEALLLDPDALADYDAVLIDSGDHFETLGADSDDPALVRGEIANNLNEFVMAGGSLYASGRAYWLLEEAFPELASFSDDESDYDA